jgi:hypothetical protein
VGPSIDNQREVALRELPHQSLDDLGRGIIWLGEPANDLEFGIVLRAEGVKAFIEARLIPTQRLHTVAADALTWRPPHPVGAVLLDAPRSATGAIRRHPDVPHLKLPEDVARLSAVQENLLWAAVAMLQPGGTLVYCSSSTAR